MFIVDNEEQKQRKQDPKNRKSLENYTAKKNLFLQFNNYLYSNIDEFQQIKDFEVIRNRIEKDFPNYGNGIFSDGIVNDFYRAELLKNESYRSHQQTYKKLILGKTFQIISISYPNFKIFSNEIYNSDFAMKYHKGGYSEFGDDFTESIFFVDLNGSKFFMGLSKGGNSLSDYEKKHNFKTEEDEMFLIFELQLNKNPPHTYPHFNVLKLRKDNSVKEYHTYFNLNLDICKKLNA
jgi:hypothetical protein